MPQDPEQGVSQLKAEKEVDQLWWNWRNNKKEQMPKAGLYAKRTSAKMKHSKENE